MKSTHLLAATLLTLTAAAAQASLITYTNKAAFLAAAGSLSTETFSSASVGTSTANYSGSFNGFTLSSVANGDKSGIATGTIAGADNISIPSSFTGQNFYGWGNSNGGAGPTTTFTFTSGITAFGFDWFNTDMSDRYSVTVNSQSTVVFNYASSGFFGVIDTAGFTSATIQTANYGGYLSTMGLDNVLTSNNSVPEPTSAALIALGLAGLGMRRRQK